MDFNKVKTFLTVSEIGSFSKAAIALGRTQPAISQAIQQLEESLGLALLERRKGRIYLTPEGETLARTGARTLGQLEDEMMKLRKDLGALTGTIRIGAVIDHGTSLLAERLASFRARYPKVKLHLSYGKSIVLERRLLRNELDMALIINFKQRDLFEVETFVEEEEVLVASPIYLKRHGNIGSYEQVLDASLIDMSEDFECFRPWLAKNKRSLLARLSRRTPAMIVESHHGMRDLVRAGTGIAMIPKHLVQEEMRQGELIQLMKSSHPTRVVAEIALRRKRTKRFSHDIFLQHLLGQDPMHPPSDPRLLRSPPSIDRSRRISDFRSPNAE